MKCHSHVIYWHRHVFPQEEVNKCMFTPMLQSSSSDIWHGTDAQGSLEGCVRVCSLNIQLIALTTGLLMGKWRTFTSKQAVSHFACRFACGMRVSMRLMAWQCAGSAALPGDSRGRPSWSVEQSQHSSSCWVLCTAVNYMCHRSSDGTRCHGSRLHASAAVSMQVVVSLAKTSHVKPVRKSM